MPENKSDKPMSWTMILLILVVIGFGTGMIMSGIRTAFGLSGSFATSGVGAVMGVCGAILITRRRALLAAQQNQKKDD